MSSNVRQFVYLDSQAVNSLLASMFMAVPKKVKEAVKETQEEDTTTSGEAKLTLGSLFRAGGSRSHSEKETNQTVSEVDQYINDQYRFSILARALEEDDNRTIYDVNEGDDIANAESGDLIRITGTCRTDPLYPLLGALEHITEATSEAPNGDGFWAQMIQNQSNIGQVQQIYKLLYGDWVGLHLAPNNGDHQFGVVVNEKQTWVDSYREFRGVNKYTILGRVQEQIGEDEIWDLIEGLRVISSATSKEQADTFRSEIIAKLLDSLEDEEPTDGLKLPKMEPDDFIIKGPATTINPIAIHW